MQGLAVLSNEGRVRSPHSSKENLCSFMLRGGSLGGSAFDQDASGHLRDILLILLYLDKCQTCAVCCCLS